MTTRQLDARTTPAWTRVHAQAASLREVIAVLDDGRPLPDPAAAETTVEPTGAFAHRDELLLALHGVWSRRLHGRLDVALETDDHDLAETRAHDRASLETSYSSATRRGGAMTATIRAPSGPAVIPCSTLEPTTDQSPPLRRLG